ncbi:probable nucleoside diphosphate kinase 5 isoform X2 [Elaeis guineensis]|uniref:probable nucleoside diphosphate kinase 5 isoform X2 n=1 Tax=Elaeis guineensis var. tenera TaxID=51953 RepID=UPI003C6CE753
MREAAKLVVSRVLAMRKISVSALHLVLLFLFAGSPSHAAMEKEKTLAMIKPDGLSLNYTDKIRKVILESGFDIIREMMVRLDAGNVTQFYAEHSKKSFFPNLVVYMTSIRAMCGLDSAKNCVHGSDSPQSAAREISFFFGDILPGFVKHDEL